MEKQFLKSIIIATLATFSISTMAEQPKEKIGLNDSYDPNGSSISVQGLANKILEEASKSKYLVTVYNGTEYAYTITKLGSGDVKYLGNHNDVEGLVFLNVVGYVDGLKLNEQLSVYRPSKYQNSIFINKFDRNEFKPYKFNLGLDSNNNLMLVNGQQNVMYLQHSNTIKKHISNKEKNKDLVY